MKHIHFTYVDAKTGISVHKEPAANGPKLPEIKGLEFVWAKESEYPTDTPNFYGRCSDDADLSVDGFIGVISEEDFNIFWNDELNARNWKPKVVSMRQARLALLNAELLSQVDAAIESFTDPKEKEAAKIEWEYATEVRRDSIFTIRLAEALQLDEAKLDELFAAAVVL